MNKMLNRKAITKIQAAIIAVLIVVVGVGSFYGGMLMAPPTPGPEWVSRAEYDGLKSDFDKLQADYKALEEQIKPPRTIKIGATVSLTGMYAPTAAINKDLFLAWEELINERGGVYVKEYGRSLPVEFIIYDDKSDPETVTKFYEKLITEDKVDVLVGPYSSVLCVPAAAVAEKYGVPLATGPAGAPPIYEDKEWVVSVIVLLKDIEKHYFDMMAKMAEEGKVKTVSLVSEDTPFGKGLHAGGKALFPAMGVEILYEELVAADTKDFTPVILKLKEANADVVFVSALAPFASTFIKQAHEQGLHPKGIFVFSVLYKTVLDSVGPAANYYVGWFHWTPALPYSGLWGKDMWIEVMNKAGFKNEEYPLQVLLYNALEALCAAIRDAGTLDKAEVMRALKNLYIESLCGPLYFTDFDNIKGIGTIAQYPVQYVNGEYTILWPPELATGEYVYPMP